MSALCSVTRGSPPTPDARAQKGRARARSLAAMSSPPPVPLSDLVSVAVQGAHGGLLRLSQQVATPLTDAQRRSAILDYVTHAQACSD